jgi:hypothetical protein
MISRLLSALALAIPTLASNAQAVTPPASTYALLALVGDKLDAVTYQPQIGTLLDANTHLAVPMTVDLLDTAALRAVNKALRATLPGTDVALLAASTPDMFADEARLFDGDHVRLPADIETAVTQEKASKLVLITKHRSEARLAVQSGFIGNGKIEGLGFYVDSYHRLEAVDNPGGTVGFLSPFVYVDVTLVDVASHAIVRRTTITASRTFVPASIAKANAVWDTLDGKAKVAALTDLLSDNLATVIPQLVQPAAH